ncbi:MAG TPA: response regulator [Burkholderiaceae bacterium]|nr:response regulator [Burkholderiaceae bacterium]
MHAFDRSFIACQALVVDGNMTSRSIIVAQLRDLGLQAVMQCNRAQDARRHIEGRHFDIVLCEQHFPGESYSGQDLLDDVRRAQLLPFSTVFVMITGEASYDKVAEAAESALDGYLLKPYTGASLAERLKQARERKLSLREIFQALENDEFERAADFCLRRFHARGRHWLYAARVGAELLLRLNRHNEAQELCEAVIASQALPWARLGIARAQIERDQPTLAKRTLESLIVEEPTYVDAYDVMGRLHVEQGNLQEALDTYRQASDLTPGSITRLQKQGMLASFLGRHDEAAKALERAATLGISSKMFDYQSLVLLGFARFDQRDSKGLQRCVDNLRHALQKASGSRRLVRFVRAVEALSCLLNRQPGAALEQVRAIAAEIPDESFDVEAGCNMVALVSSLVASELKLEDAEQWVEQIAMRFCLSKALVELLASAGQRCPALSEIVRQSHSRIIRIAEDCMVHTLKGDPRKTVEMLVDHASRTLNSKLIEMARLTLQRHAERIEDGAHLASQIEDLRRLYAPAAVCTPLGKDTGRQAGGMTLRSCAPAAVQT